MSVSFRITKEREEKKATVNKNYRATAPGSLSSLPILSKLIPGKLEGMSFTRTSVSGLCQEDMRLTSRFPMTGNGFGPGGNGSFLFDPNSHWLRR